MEKKFYVLIVALFVVAQGVTAKSWRINPTLTAKANFTSFALAMESEEVMDGDTIYLDPGITLGESTITKAVTIIGPGYNLDDPTKESKILEKLAVKVEQVKVLGCIISTIELSVGNFTVENSKFNHLRSFDKSGNVIINSCYIVGQLGGNNQSFGGPKLYCEVSNCIILGTISTLSYSTIANNVVLSHSPCAEIANSNFINNIFISTSPNYADIAESCFTNSNTITNNLFGMPKTDTHANFPNNKFGVALTDVFAMEGEYETIYKLKEGSPAIGYGLGGYDCGAFSGARPYRLFGRSEIIPSIYNVEIPSYPTNNKLTVTFKVKANNE